MGPSLLSADAGPDVYRSEGWLPERDISSLCVMGWGLEMLENSSAVVVAVVVVAAAAPPDLLTY